MHSITVAELTKNLQQQAPNYIITYLQYRKQLIKTKNKGVRQMENKVICTYDDWFIVAIGEKQYYVCLDDMIVTEVEMVEAFAMDGTETEKELCEGLLISKKIKFDCSGELDEGNIYCYWRNVDTAE